MNEKSKLYLAYLILAILIILILILTYIRLFSLSLVRIEEKPINNSNSKAIQNALVDITTNFNKNINVINYSNNNDVSLKASVNNFSIFVNYTDDTTITYEFTLQKTEDLSLDINISNNDKVDENKFNTIYCFLVEAVQKRLNNNVNLLNEINDFLINDIPCEGLSKKKTKNGIQYQINIMDKIIPKERAVE